MKYSHKCSSYFENGVFVSIISQELSPKRGRKNGVFQVLSDWKSEPLKVGVFIRRIYKLRELLRQCYAGNK